MGREPIGRSHDREFSRQRQTGIEISGLLRGYIGRAAELHTTLLGGAGAEAISFIQRGIVVTPLVDRGPYPPGVSDIRALRVSGSTLEQKGGIVEQGENVWLMPGSRETAKVETKEDGTIVTWQIPESAAQLILRLHNS